MSQTIDRTVSTIAREATATRGARNFLDEVIERTIESGFDAEMFHVMDQRDTRLLQDEILGGPRSSKFIYDFEIQGQKIRGISAVGARELATYYRGIRHHLISSTRKVGSLFVFTTYPREGIPPKMETSLLPELKEEPDGYEAVCEVEDVKTGNRMMAAKFEAQWEWSQKGNRYFEKPHFATIAQSKAQRNGILMVIPQAIQLQWMEEIAAMGKTTSITAGVLEEKRSGVLRYSASQGIPIDRAVLETLLLEQIMGLGEAARLKDKDAFLAAAVALRLVPLTTQAQGTSLPDNPADPGNGASGPAAPSTRGTRRRAPNAPADAKPPGQPPQDQRQPANPANASEARQAGPGTGTDATTTTGASGPANGQAATTGATGGPPPEGGFEAWLCDANGKEAYDQPHTNPVEFANDLAELCRETPARTEDLWMVNLPAIEDACDASEEARKIIEAIDTKPKPAAPDQAPSGPQPVAVPLENGAPNWPGYADACRAELDTLTDLAAVDAWEQRNQSTYRDKLQPDTLVKRHLAATRSRISPPASPRRRVAADPAAAAPQRTEAENEDRDRRLVDGIENNVKALADKHAVTSYQNSPGVTAPRARFEHEGKVALVKRIDDAFAARMAALS